MSTGSAVAVLGFVHYIAQAKNAASVLMSTVTKAGIFYKSQRYLQRSPFIVWSNFYSKITRLSVFYTTAPYRFIQALGCLALGTTDKTHACTYVFVTLCSPQLS